MGDIYILNRGHKLDHTRSAAKLERLKAKGWRQVASVHGFNCSIHYPEGEELAIDRIFRLPDELVSDSPKCPGCNWEVGYLYVLATSQEEAEQLHKDEGYGLCCDCVTSMLMEGQNTIGAYCNG